MKEVSALLGFRESIRVVDATLRDGGIVNDFKFGDDFVKELYQTNIATGVDYMEVGYKASKKLFDESKFGKWKFCDDDEIFKVLGDNSEKKIKLAAMADVGRCDYKNDIRDRSNSPLDLIRVACYAHQIPGALEIIEDAKAKGYEVTCNIMAISTAQEGDIKVALDMLGKSSVDCIYIVDSYGSIYPEQMQRIAATYKEFADKYGKTLGIHAHNNQQLAFANTIEAVGDGVDWLDATYSGMGRGAGNCFIENLLAFFEKSEIQYLSRAQVRGNKNGRLEKRRRGLGLRRSVSCNGIVESASAHGDRIHERKAHGLFQVLRRTNRARIVS